MTNSGASAATPTIWQGACRAPRTPRKHGTPAQFSAAVWAAHAQLFITTAEAVESIRKYEREWCDARRLSAPGGGGE